MLKKRLIFTLLANQMRFMLSRNFTLQAAGDLDWIMAHYDFDSIAFSIDELVVLDVTRGQRDLTYFAALLRDISKRCFMPVAAGGGIRSVEDVQRLLSSGADKIVVNTPLFRNPDLIRQLVARFGAQCIVASIDYKKIGIDEGEVFIDNGSCATGITVPDAITLAQELGVGELYLTSIAKDGTGQGLDIKYLSEICKDSTCPIVISGGAGNYQHLSEALAAPFVSAVSTANLFNFMSDNLTDARDHIIASGTPLAKWEKISRGISP
jgi:cyclase